MGKYLKEGQMVKIEQNSYAKVLKKLGEGGQGAVYLTEYLGRQYALKWYRPGVFRDSEKENIFRKNIFNNITDGPPNNKFIWPKFLTADEPGQLGYLMEVFPSEYVSFSKILVDPANHKISLEATINAALNIINAFRDLHRAGKSYQDINDGGFVVRLEDGDVLICDCDNIADKNLGIAGKPGYMAPEIVTGGGKVKPSALTDKYSLSNILFRLLFRGDPLAGALDSAKVCLTDKAERELYGENPIFVYDPDNDTNRPVRGVHNNIIRSWQTYPQFIKDAFIEAFTVGAKNPNRRREINEWQKLFVRLKGELIQCQNPLCGVRSFVDIFIKKDETLICPGCKQEHPMPKLITPNSFPVYLFPGVKLLHGHTTSITNSLNSEGYLTQTGLVVKNPKNPARWGIRNMSGGAWSCLKPDADSRQNLESGKTIAVEAGLEIRFNNGQTVKVQ